MKYRIVKAKNKFGHTAFFVQYRKFLGRWHFLIEPGRTTAKGYTSKKEAFSKVPAAYQEKCKFYTTF